MIFHPSSMLVLSGWRFVSFHSRMAIVVMFILFSSLPAHAGTIDFRAEYAAAADNGALRITQTGSDPAYHVSSYVLTGGFNWMKIETGSSSADDSPIWKNGETRTAAVPQGVEPALPVLVNFHDKAGMLLGIALLSEQAKRELRPWPPHIVGTRDNDSVVRLSRKDGGQDGTALILVPERSTLDVLKRPFVEAKQPARPLVLEAGQRELSAAIDPAWPAWLYYRRVDSATGKVEASLFYLPPTRNAVKNIPFYWRYSRFWLGAGALLLILSVMAAWKRGSESGAGS